ncbi:hypothetical protein ZEAMMB73_Zm00001d036530 [Zea mays]|nr:hypothetical protein ZEAMMB73_Zm00001d036530 [Zea mays]AQK81291.1 hypothetical protein ZEAMMB73_Zm00001d036530 [Zea mays]
MDQELEPQRHASEEQFSRFLLYEVDAIRKVGLINYLNVVYLRYCLNVWDVGGQKTIMSYWRNYFEQTNGLVWFADSSDIRRLDDCRAELHNLLKEEFDVGAKGYAKLNVVSSVMLYYGCSEASNFSVYCNTWVHLVTLRQLIAAWFSCRYTRFKKRYADFHGRAADLVHGLRGTAMPRRQALEEEQCTEEKGISTIPKHKYASKACSPKVTQFGQKKLYFSSDAAFLGYSLILTIVGEHVVASFMGSGRLTDLCVLIILELVLTIEASGGIAPIVSVLQLWMSVDKRCIREKHFKVNLLSKLEMLDFVFWLLMGGE